MSNDDLMDTTTLLEHRKQIVNFSKDLFRICGIEFARTSELQRQISGAFLFGLVFAHGRMNSLAPAEVHALAITMLQDILGYSVAQAGAFSTRLIEASEAGPDDTMNPIIHRGIDGHRQLTTGQLDSLRKNLLDIFNALDAPYVG